ncbi:MAG: bifunctional 5,10-methylenetetrahydrofolate dehydrogenase/5,10-methenyltetrahydrofolate cyclohydrolase [Planctomycetes bacterium]|nr:bifunctional 5,10-methylenetetrahydrofolate dehydrogenase/5,10-methenyltetrahydrofolate cyclohydrolase [Planctomycetota bacterium]
MSAQIIDGDAVAGKIKDALKKDIRELKKAGRGPHLRAVQVGENPASKMYVRGQQRSCEEIGIAYTLDQLPETTNEEQLIDHIHKLNADPGTTGVILQMPLPEGVNPRKIQSLIAPNKDVEGMNPANMGMVVYGNPNPGPCTACGAVELVKATGVQIQGKEVTVVGHSEIVGKPIAILMLGLNATVTTVHIFTKDIKPAVKNAEILFVAAGKSQALWLRYERALKKYEKTKEGAPPPLPDLSFLVTGDMIRPGAIVIDVAINRIPEALDVTGMPILDAKGKPKIKTVGDVEYEKAKEIASFITPVPGGVGPMTVALLLKNTVECAKKMK